MKVYGLLLLAAFAHSAKVNTNRAQLEPGSGPVVITHAELGGAGSEVSVSCSDGTAVLTLTNTGTRKLAGAFTFKRGSNACNVPETALTGPGEVATATATAACGRIGDSNSWRWDVIVSENYENTIATIESNFETDITVVCASTVNNPSTVAGVTRPPVQTEGTASYDQTIPFNLVPVANPTNPRQWLFSLTPADVTTLRGLQYQISKFTASARPGENPLAADLILSRCIVDRTSMSVARGDETTLETLIRIAAFQFKGAKDEPISFAAEVVLCTAEGTETCEPVQTAEQCESAVDPEPVVSETRDVSGRRAVNVQRSRRSLSTPFFGKLTVKDVVIV